MSGSRRRLRTVVDTNLFVSAAVFKRGNPYALRRAWHDGAFELLLSEAHRAELIDVFGRPRLIQRYRVAPEDLAEFFTDLAEATLVEPTPTVPMPVRDPIDVKILAAALGGGADYPVTGDADLLELRNASQLGTLQSVTVAEFLAILDQAAPPPGTDR